MGINSRKREIGAEVVAKVQSGQTAISQHLSPSFDGLAMGGYTTPHVTWQRPYS